MVHIYPCGYKESYKMSESIKCPLSFLLKAQTINRMIEQEDWMKECSSWDQIFIQKFEYFFLKKFRYFWVVIVVATQNRKWIAKRLVDNKIIQKAKIPFSEKRGKVFF